MSHTIEYTLRTFFAKKYRSLTTFIAKNRTLFWIIVPGFFFQLLMIFPSGSYYCFGAKCGIFFWGAHAHDGIWHLALSAASFRSFPFQMPTFAGRPLSGYNFLMDLVMFLLTILGLAPIVTYFKLLPIVWFILFTYLAITLARRLHDSNLFVGLLLFFFYFGGSLGYILSLMHSGTIWNSEGLLTIQSGHTLINLQYAFSLACLIGIVVFLKKKELNFRNVVLLSLLGGLTIALKFYAGVVAAVLIGVYILRATLFEKKIKDFVMWSATFLLIMAVFVILFYNPQLSGSVGRILVFDPLATVHPMIEDPHLLYMPVMANERYILKAVRIGPKFIRIEIITFLYFILFNWGTRIVQLKR